MPHQYLGSEYQKISSCPNIQDPVQRAAVYGEQVVREASDHDPRDEVREKRYGLHDGFDPAPLDLVHEKGINEDDREVRPDSDERYVNGIAEIPVRAERVRRENVDEIFQPDKFAPQNAAQQFVLLKGDKDAEHRSVTENAHERHGREQEQVQHPMPLDVPHRFPAHHVFQARAYIMIVFDRLADARLCLRSFHSLSPSFRCFSTTRLPLLYR